MYKVYIIKSLKDGRFYVGFTNNLERRLAEHNRGCSSTISTSHRGPFELVYVEETSSRGEAREREKFFKSGQGRKWREGYLKTKYIPE